MTSTLDREDTSGVEPGEQPRRYYVDGEWRTPNSGGAFDDLEPYTGDRYARVADCGPDEIAAAVVTGPGGIPIGSKTSTRRTGPDRRALAPGPPPPPGSAPPR